ncbi:hypothetical protein OEZ86_014673 [Tetradesmus obliquus]|nr:hypothetical protein OEZ86_014673 [Tetradesmus obliquus]
MHAHSLAQRARQAGAKLPRQATLSVASRSLRPSRVRAESSATAVVSKPLEEASAVVQTTAEAGSGVQAAAAPAAVEPQQQVVYKTVKQLRMRSAAAYLPHPEKESYGGEDAHFVSNISGGAIGVADGVGGWAESGVNPAEYSRTLMRVACAYIEGADTREVASGSVESACASMSSMDGGCSPYSSTDAPAVVVDPRAALDTAHKLTKKAGSATACVVQLCPEQKALIAANLGDSGFIVVRNGEIALRSSPKQHFFDCPLQFGAYPEFVDGTDTADDAEIFHLPVQPGDIVVAGSDGLWDNVYAKEVLELLPRSAEGVDAAADKIAKLARRHAADEDFASPYTAEAKAQGLDWPWWMKVMNTKLKDGKVQLGELTGGKMDDITVLVAMVVEEDVQVPQPAAAAAVPAAAAAASENGNGNGASANGAAASNGNGAAAANGNGNGAAFDIALLNGAV